MQEGNEVIMASPTPAAGPVDAASDTGMTSANATTTTIAGG